MAKIWGQLERAQIENVSADPTGGGLSTGRFWFRTDLSELRIYNGSTTKNILISGGAAIVNADISASAAIAYSKLNLTGSILNADVNAAAAVAGTKISPDFGAQDVTTTGAITATSVRTKRIGETENLGLTVSAGVLTLCSASGAALSSTNPGYVTLPSVSNAGRSVTLKVTSNRTFNDSSSGSSNFGASGTTFGETVNVAWNSIMPFYLHSCNLDDTDANLEFYFSRNPVSIVISSRHGFKGTAPVTNDIVNAMFMRATSPASYVGKPAVRIGGFFASKNSSNDWAFGLSSNTALQGITPIPHVSTRWAMAQGQNSAVASSWLFTSGTAPTWASLWTTESQNTYGYEVQLNGQVSVYFNTTDRGNCTNGSGGNDLYLALPCAWGQVPSTTSMIIPVGSYSANAAATTTGGLFGSVTADSGSSNPNLMGLVQSNASTTLKDNSFSSSGNDLSVFFTYRSFTGI